MGIEIRIETEEITIGIIIGPITEIGQGPTIGMTIGKTTIDQMIGKTITDLMIGKTVTDKMIGETTIDKTMEGTIIEIGKITEEIINRDIEIEVKVGRIQEIITVTIQEREVEIGVETDKCEQELEHYLMIEKTGQGLDLTPG